MMQLNKIFIVKMFIIIAVVMHAFLLGSSMQISCGKVWAGTDSPPPSDQISSQGFPAPLMLMQKISQAQHDGKYVYLFFYKSDGMDSETMSAHLDEASKKIGSRVEIIRVNISDPLNAPIVGSMKIKSENIPLVHLKDPTGRLIRIFNQSATVDDFLKAIPSPKKDETLACIRKGNILILTFAKPEMALYPEILSRCEEIKARLADKAECVTVDVSDPAEADFLKEARVDADIKEPVTYVFNMTGKVSGRYEGSVSVDELVSAAITIAAPRIP